MKAQMEGHLMNHSRLTWPLSTFAGLWLTGWDCEFGGSLADVEGSPQAGPWIGYHGSKRARYFSILILVPQYLGDRRDILENCQPMLCCKCSTKTQRYFDVVGKKLEFISRSNIRRQNCSTLRGVKRGVKQKHVNAVWLWFPWSSFAFWYSNFIPGYVLTTLSYFILSGWRFTAMISLSQACFSFSICIPLHPS